MSCVLTFVKVDAEYGSIVLGFVVRSTVNLENCEV